MKNRWTVAVCLGGALAAAVSMATPASETFRTATATWAAGRQDEKNVFLGFRARFVATTPSAPTLRVAASSVYRVRLNGAFLAAGPARTRKGAALVDEWPLKGARNGENEVVIEVCSYNNAPSFQYHVQPGFVQAEIVAGEQTLAATPKDFSAFELARSRAEPPYSHQRNFPTERWTVGGAEKPVAVSSVAGPTLERRPMPQPEFWVNRAFRPVGASSLRELPFIDSGFVGVRVRCSTPVRVTVRFEEALVNGRLDMKRNGDPATSWHAMQNTVTWDVLKAGDYTLESLEPYALKYAEAKVEGGKGEIADLYVRQYRSPHPERVIFASSDPALDRIVAAALNSLAENAVDLYTDCPGRERSAWLCDSRFTGMTMARLTGDLSIERKQLENFALSGCKNGVLPETMSGCFPGENLLPSWMLWYVIQCAEYVRRAPNGDPAFRETVRARVKANVDYLLRFENADGLLESLPGWVFVEWSKANELTKGVSYPVNALWSHALACAGELCGRDDWARKAEAVRQAIARQSFDGTYFRDHAERDAKGVLQVRPERSEVCQYYQFYFGVASRERHARLWNRLRTDFRPGHAQDGLYPCNLFFGRMLRLELLGRFGQGERVADEIKAAFGTMAEESGTLWEFADGHDSRCHAFGSALILALMEGALGIADIDWLQRTITLREAAFRLDWFDLALPTAEGTLRVRGRRNGRSATLAAELPKGWRRR